ncbi:hypothetical protein SAMN05444397_10955 [Flavobacterium aquidurense]|uniref:Lipoprotein n=1 Tax=Flavobacterium frigidimaris TaxID=262320 RepID=A0ABX4BP53_FLAFR|nr:hypothetical protein [Flavobacterium frigidimaris]OXA78561.1 hypothetical protein B0A65_12550 [Flavobacterium frigidimaris]SDZ56995.1 hypothetical protein SAMN05444397_10955 [Flavobacterium aquidurense]
MKKITILVFLIFISCNNPRKDKKVNVEKKISKEKVIENIAVLRKCGFYEEFQNLTDTEVYNKLHSNRIKEYSEMFKKPYDPGMNIDEFDLGCLDKHKMLYMDLESDVCAQNKVYRDVINMFSVISKGTFNPENIEEKWQSESGPITIQFKSNNEIIKFEPEYSDDWLDGKIFDICINQIKIKNIRIVECLGESKYGYGQCVSFMRLTESEQKILEKEYHYKFRN